MADNSGFTPLEARTIDTIHELQVALKQIEDIEIQIANPPDDSSDYKPQLTPQGMKLVKVPSEGESARVDRLENNIYDLKAGALSTIEKNNSELPEADRQQLQKESIVTLYSDKRSLELISNKNDQQTRSMALSQEKDMALKAREYRMEMNHPGAPSAGVRMSFPELFQPTEADMSFQKLDIREIEFTENAHQIGTRPEQARIEGPQAQAQIGAPMDITPLELPQGPIHETFLLNAPDITLPEPQLPGEDD